MQGLINMRAGQPPPGTVAVGGTYRAGRCWVLGGVITMAQYSCPLSRFLVGMAEQSPQAALCTAGGVQSWAMAAAGGVPHSLLLQLQQTEVHMTSGWV